MKKYKFKLQGLLKLREFREHQEKLNLSKINKEIVRINDLIDKANVDIKIAYESADKLIEQGMDGQMISFYPMFIKSKRELIAQLEAQLTTLHQGHKVQVMTLAHHRGEVKVIENMKEKELSKYKKEQEKKTQEKIDDILMARKAIEMGET